MYRKTNPKWRILMFCTIEGLILFGVWWGIQKEIASVNQAVNEVSDLRDPSPFRAALLGQLGKIHVALEGYLRSPDASLEKQIDESRKDFEMLLPEFTRQNPKLFPAAANDEIKRGFEILKGTIDHTLDANIHRMAGRAALAGNFERILLLIEHNIRPMIRKEQADGLERGEAIVNIENQMRAWQQNLAQAWTQPSEAASALPYENENRGETYLELYSAMDLLPRERKVLHEIRTLWQTNDDLARESFVKESLVTQAEKAMDAQRLQIIGVLNRYLPALPPSELDAKKQAIITTMRLHMAGVGGIALVGLVSLTIVVLGIYRTLHAPIPVADGVYRAPENRTSRPTDASLQMNLKGLITEWSPGAEAMYGYTAVEMLGESIAKIFESESEIARLGQELQKAKGAAFDTSHKTKGGAAILVRIEFHSVADPAGRAVAISLNCSRR
jgi:PAS domain S-box-containing protein